MMECRRLILSEHSVFHFEYACLQWRKIIEGLAQSWVIAAEIAGIEVSENLKSSNKPLAFFNQLSKKSAFKFPQPIRINWGDRINDMPTQHHIDNIGDPIKCAKGIVDYYEKIHVFMHSISPYNEIPLENELSQLLIKNFRSLLIDSQKIWNLYWQHRIQISDEVFVINLASDSQNELPQIIKTTGVPYTLNGTNLIASTERIAGWANPPEWTELRKEI
jgi:hypothetical protein